MTAPSTKISRYEIWLQINKVGWLDCIDPTDVIFIPKTLSTPE
jgi:hypothetical protein